jgi:hypothetical protein
MAERCGQGVDRPAEPVSRADFILARRIVGQAEPDFVDGTANIAILQESRGGVVNGLFVNPAAVIAICGSGWFLLPCRARNAARQKPHHQPQLRYRHEALGMSPLFCPPCFIGFTAYRYFFCQILLL